MPPEFPTYIPILAALITGACSFAGAWLATIFGKRSERRHEARQLAKAFKGELSAIVSILELRNYQAALRKCADKCIEFDQVHIFAVSAQQEYRAIYKSNASKIGCLPQGLPEQIAIVYTQATSLLEDFHSSIELQAGRKPLSILGSPVQAAERYRRIADHIEQIIDMAKKTIAEIDRMYPAS